MSDTKDPTTKANYYPALIRELGGFESFAELRRSEAFGRREAALRNLFNQARVHQCPAASPRLGSFLRVVEWNIERGAQLEGIIRTLNTHPILRFADLLLLNEVDDGMLRSGNRDVALELSRALEAHAVYGIEYLEMTRGIGEEAKLAGDNTSGLHGNAILTRHMLRGSSIVRLPRCEDNYGSEEKRLGGRIGIIAEIEIDGAKLVAATSHLDVVNTPRCRDRQFAPLLAHIDDGGAARGDQLPIIFGGDLNTHTFARGGRLRALGNVLRIVSKSTEQLSKALLHPERREPVLRRLERRGYDIASLNDGNATGRTVVSSGSDATSLPGPIRKWALGRLPHAGLLLEFRLDWLASRGLRPLTRGELVDPHTGVASIDPLTVANLSRYGLRISDHDPIVADIAFPNPSHRNGPKS